MRSQVVVGDLFEVKCISIATTRRVSMYCMEVCMYVLGRRVLIRFLLPIN